MTRAKEAANRAPALLQTIVGANAKVIELSDGTVVAARQAKAALADLRSAIVRLTRIVQNLRNTFIMAGDPPDADAIMRRLDALGNRVAQVNVPDPDLDAII